jgi:YesN/AraC family two-component response regulator
MEVILSYRTIIIDDEKEISNGFAQYFPWKDLGFTITGQFSGAKSALQFIKTNPVDVIVSDVIMPGMTGIELAQQLANTNLNPQPLVILFSAYDEFEYVREAVRYRCTDYILKSTDYDELIRIFSDLKKKIDKDRHITEETEEDKIIGIIKKYVKDNPAIASLESVSMLVYLSPAYVSKYFKERTSISFSDYLLKTKMEIAGTLLVDLKYKIYDVSTVLGYSNPENFTRSFKKFYGVSPREYRFRKMGRYQCIDGEND